MQRERALVVIIAYKFAKGGLWFALALGMSVAMRMGLGDHLRGFADHLQHHAHAWSLRLAELLVRASTPRGLWTVVVALIADGISSFIEGWALYRGRWWGPWLVVVATASLLPFEVVALSHHPHVVRAALFLLNIAIVLYLGRQALREHRKARSLRAAGPLTNAPETTPLRTPPPPGG
jgi:GTP-binding protein